MKRLTNKIDIDADIDYEINRKDEFLVIERLGKLEDLMEEYGIENLEELECYLGYTVEYDVITRLEYERDTWKKACELACEYIFELLHMGNMKKIIMTEMIRHY